VTIGALETGKMGEKEKRGERKKGRAMHERVPYDATIKAIVDALLGAGIEFINIRGEDADWIGVRLKISKRREIVDETEAANA
jgi:hypothetical protein